MKKTNRVTKGLTLKSQAFFIFKVKLRLEDNGVGIAEKELENLFIRYYRGTNTRETHKGSELGLAISKQVVEVHGGETFVKSQLGKGTRTWIVF